MRSPRRAVYTALIGDYEDLLEQPLAAESSLEFICFTDNPKLTSTTWDVRLIEPRFPDDPVRSARLLKIRGHSDLSVFDETLWIDNTVLLRVTPEEILDEWLASADVAIPEHSFRDTVALEFEEIFKYRIDDPARVREQYRAYAKAYPAMLESKQLWTAMLARRRNERVAETMCVWLDHVLRYSRRDQLSVAVALASTSSRVKYIEVDNLVSQWHTWPQAINRKSRHGPGLVAQVLNSGEEWDQSPDASLLQTARAVGVRELLIGQLEARTGQLEGQLEAVLSSRAWRLSKPVRVAAGAARKVGARIRRQKD